MPDNSTRDRIRALVRDVLDKSIPADAPVRPDAPATASRFIDAVPNIPRTTTETSAIRDESSKTIITEDDVRNLADGATLRIAEGARLTPLAADIVSAKKIELVRRGPRRGSKNFWLVAGRAGPRGLRVEEKIQKLLARLGYPGPCFGNEFEKSGG